MLDDERYAQLRAAVIERFSADELIELLQLETEDIVSAFEDEIFQWQLSKILEEMEYTVEDQIDD